MRSTTAAPTPARELLERLRPKLAAIEVSVSTWPPGAPTLAAPKRAGVRVYRTDRDGTSR